MYKKNLQNTFFINQIKIVYYSNCIIFSHIPKVNSVSTFFNINDSNIIKTIAFCIKSWQPLQRYNSYLKPISLKYQKWQISHSFDALVLLTSITPKILILSYSSIYTYTHTKRHLKIFLDKAYHLLQKQI